MEESTSGMQVLDEVQRLPLDRIDAEIVASIVSRIIAVEQDGTAIDVARFSSSI